MKDRAIRIKLTSKIIRKRLYLVSQIAPDLYKKLHKEPGRVRDKHPLDCGKAKCKLCHRDKIFKKKKVSDIKKELGMIDGRED